MRYRFAAGSFAVAFAVGGLTIAGGIPTAHGAVLNDVTDVSAGASHGCAARSDGTATCWGANQQGQLGDGTAITPRGVATPVKHESGSGNLVDVIAVHAGGSHSCALKSDGTARCWGDNDRGQLGDGTTTDRHLPVAVKDETGTEPLSGIVRLVAGATHTCAVLNDLMARCWGGNGSGRLGNGTTTPTSLPTVVKNEGGSGPLGSVADIQTGEGGAHVCARLLDSTARCWGANNNGQLGDGTTTGRKLPVAVKNESGSGVLANVIGIGAAGSHSCALLNGGGVRCWGLNNKGQVGDGTTTNRSLPVTVASLTDVTGIAAGALSSCAVLNDQSTTCWGTNQYGQIAQPAGGFFSQPHAFHGPATQVAAGNELICTLLTDGTVQCSGRNDKGQLTASTIPSPGVAIIRSGVPFVTITQISAGLGHSCARLSDGTARCWGFNAFSELGDGTTTHTTLPVIVQNAAGTGPLTGVAQIVAGHNTTCARLDDGTARCWGATTGMVGDGTTVPRNRPTVVKNSTGTGALTGVTQLAAGYLHVCAVLSNQTAKCWGANGDGQLGDDSQDNRTLPVTVKHSSGIGALTGVTQIAVSGQEDSANHPHTCARLVNQTARCWGANQRGQLGDGTTTTPRLLPVPVRNETSTGNLTGVGEVATGAEHSCARILDGTARCWGRNDDGQVGDGTTSTRLLPVPVRDELGGGVLNNVSRIVAGHDTTCAVASQSHARCWGNGDAGAIGDGTSFEDRLLPVVVRSETGDPLAAVAQIDTSGSRTVARTFFTAAFSWGAPANGDGTLVGRLVPTLVMNA